MIRVVGGELGEGGRAVVKVDFFFFTCGSLLPSYFDIAFLRGGDVHRLGI